MILAICLLLLSFGQTLFGVSRLCEPQSTTPGWGIAVSLIGGIMFAVLGIHVAHTGGL